MIIRLKNMALLLATLSCCLLVVSDVIAKNACLDIFTNEMAGRNLSLDLPFARLNFKGGTTIDSDNWGEEEELILVPDDDNDKNNYWKIVVPTGKTLIFPSIDSRYYIRRLVLKDGAHVIFNPGDYRFGSLRVGSEATILVPEITSGSPSETARLYIDQGLKPNGDLTTGQLTVAAGGIEVDHETKFTGLNNLVVVARHASFQQNTIFKGALFIKKTATLGGEFTGAVAALNTIEKRDNVSYVYSSDAITAIDFNGMCQASKTPASLMHYYTFDDDWEQSKVLTDIGPMKKNGTVIGRVTKIRSKTSGIHKGDTCFAADFNGGIIEFDQLAVSDKFGDKTSISFWMYWDGNSGDNVIGWGRYDLWFMDSILGFNTWTGDRYGVASSEVKVGWNHVVAVFVNGYFYAPKLYINSVAVDAMELIGYPDEHDAFTGSVMTLGGVINSSEYRFSGSIDNLKIYQGEITQNQVSNDFSEGCGELEAVLEWHLDELSWPDNSQAEIIDHSNTSQDGRVVDRLGPSPSSGHATNVADGKICRAGSINDDTSAANTFAFDTNFTITSKGAISFWYRANGRWLTENQHTLFDASSDMIGETHDPYFLLRKRVDGGIDFWLEDSNDYDMQYSSQRLTIADDSWVHIVASWDLIAGIISLHINGQPVQLTQNHRDIASSNGQIGNLSSLYFGDTRTSSYIVNPEKLHTADGQFDEVVIFNRVLTNKQAESVYDNQSQQLTWDGEPRHCEPVLDVRFDQASWGAGSAVIDSSEYQNHGIATEVTAGLGVGDMCFAPTLDGTNYLKFSNTLELEVGKENQDFTVSYWIKVDDVQSNGWLSIIHKGSTAWERTFASWLHASIRGPHVTLSTIDRWNNPIDGDKSPKNTWLHIALLKNNHRFSLFVNGEKFSSIDLSTNSVSNTGPLTIGKSFSSNGMRGQLDELVIFSEAKSAKFIKQIYDNNYNKLNWDGTEKSACEHAPTVNHYRLSIENEYGLTCEPKPMTIKACTNDSCSTLYDKEVSVTMLPSNGWSAANPIVFTGETKDLTYRKKSVDKVSYGMAQATPAAPFRCYIQSELVNDEQCFTSFKQAGFKFTYDGSNEISTQSAGVIFPKTLKIHAITAGKDGVCVDFLEAGKNFELAHQSILPNDITALKFMVKNYESIAKNSDDVSDFTPISLDFVNGVAVIPRPRYQDAGLMSLHARYLDEDIELVGGSNAFWVKPVRLWSQFNLQNVDIFKAGDDFGLRIGAYNLNNDITVNYRPGQFKLSVVRLAPLISGTRDGKFQYAAGQIKHSTTTTSFSNINLTQFKLGQFEFHQTQYSEVGNLKVEIKDINYGGQGLIINGPAIISPRFVPDRFDLTIYDGSLAGNNGRSFAYIGEKKSSTSLAGALNYSSRPEISILPVNKQGEPTQNYLGDFNKLSVADIHIIAPTADALQNGRDNLTKMELSAQMSVGVLSPKLQPVPMTYSLAANDSFYYKRNSNSMINPFTSKINIAINSIIDSDGVKAQVLPLIEPQGGKILYGRAMLSNTYGPETSQLNMPLSLQYFIDGIFQINTKEKLYQYRGQDLLFAPLGELAASELNDVNQTVVDGLGSLVLKAPGVGHVGSRVITMPTLPWLKFDWDGDVATGLQNPFATATFGRYRGNDRLIYWHEVK